MNFRKAFFLAIFLCFLPNAAQAMWKLQAMIEKECPSKWYDLMLNQGDLAGFLEETKKLGLNPHLYTSNLNKTALSVACAQDKSGEYVSMLLKLDAINSEGKPLSKAVNAENWTAVNMLITCKDLEFSQEELDYAWEMMSQR